MKKMEMRDQQENIVKGHNTQQTPTLFWSLTPSSRGTMLTNKPVTQEMTKNDMLKF